MADNLKIYDEITHLELKDVDLDNGYIYPHQIKIDIIPAHYEYIPNTFIKQRIKEQFVYEPCMLYHKYTNDELIIKYKKYLFDTDYVVIKIAEGVATKEEYFEVLQERAKMRKLINNIQQLMGGDNNEIA